jgi:hypothetical protein
MNQHPVKYYKYQNLERPFAPGISYLETQHGGVIRQVIVKGEMYIGSNVDYPDWGMVRPSSGANYDVESSLTPITKEEFEQIWQAHLAVRQPEWTRVKQAYPIGMPVQGFIRLFYFQGVLINCGGAVLGTADYDACLASTKPEYLYTRHKVTAVVAGYEELNQWLILGSPQVYQEQIE